ncbi:MAG: hypothetical protein SNG27_07685 [Rikenellaceae bacterium]
MRKIRIKQATLSFRSLKVKYEEVINENGSETTNDFTVACGALCHEDLIASLAALKPHLAFLCDLKEVSVESALKVDLHSYDFGESLDKVFISGIKISHDTSGEVVTIFGSKTTPSGRFLDLTAPSVADSDKKYEYVSELYEALERIRSEVYAYLFEGKCCYKQMELFDEEITSVEASPEVLAEEVAEAPKPKKRGRKSTVNLPLAS